jgi:hypothetical protein
MFCLELCAVNWFQTISEGKNSTWASQSHMHRFVLGYVWMCRAGTPAPFLASGKCMRDRLQIDCRLVTVPCPPRWVTYSRTSDPTCTRDCMHPTATGVAGPAEARRGPGARPSTHDVLCANNGAGGDDRGLALLALTRS